VHLVRILRVLAASSAAVLTVALLSVPAQAAPPSGSTGQFMVVARSASEYNAVRNSFARAGNKIVRELPQIKTFVIQGSTEASTRMGADPRVLGVVPDHVETITSDRQQPNLSAPGLRSATRVNLPATAQGPSAAAIDPDPAFDINGLQWDFRRIGLPQGWNTTAGRNDVTVAVADTGLDFTHADLKPRIADVIDFTQTEAPPLCKTFFGQSDQDLARQFGGPATTDWNGHGSWIGGNIAAALNDKGINGIAPRVSLVALKISQWCGSAYDSTILSAFLTAANAGMDVVSISFGGYLDRSDPAQELIYQLYVDTVAFARSQGTTIVASAGNEHVRVGAGGRVVSHGPLTSPTDPFEDLFGLYETPGGIPGVVDVSATGNVTKGSSASCPPGTIGSASNTNATCKPTSDRHDPFGVGQQNQLAYYSNYGPRIDIAAPGGARKFNLPVWDRGGTPGFPYTVADGTNVWEDFSTTSNWAVEIPCFTLPASAGFPANQCYSSIQGTSMATPHVSAAIALEASAHPNLRHDPAALIARVKSLTTHPTNRTPGLSATDRSPGDLTGDRCTHGYCHLGGEAISNRDAYGAGLLNVRTP
jgi:subtilisin family serine protease